MKERYLEVDNGNGVEFNWMIDYYLAGPMTGYAEYNYPAFESACLSLRDAEIVVKSPHELFPEDPAEIRGKRPYEEYMTACLKLLEECKGIILLAGWPTSPGAMRELERAIELELPVYYYCESVSGDYNILFCMNRLPS